MKTSHLVISETISVKNVQVDLIPESNKEKESLDNPSENEKTVFGDHIILYLEGKFPGFTFNRMLNDTNFPIRITAELISTKGF